jgi:hypothetical protein
MTGRQAFAIAPAVLLALFGACATLAGILRRRLLRLRRWSDRQPLEIVGLVTLGAAAVFGLLLWWRWSA